MDTDALDAVIEFRALLSMPCSDMSEEQRKTVAHFRDLSPHEKQMLDEHGQYPYRLLLLDLSYLIDIAVGNESWIATQGREISLRDLTTGLTTGVPRRDDRALEDISGTLRMTQPEPDTAQTQRRVADGKYIE